MKNYGFVNVASAIPSVKVADVDYNVAEIERLVEEANEQQVDLLVFPELSLTGYSCQDLFRQATLLDAVKAAIGRLYECAIHNQVVFVVGAPIEVDGTLYNAAIVFSPKNYPSAVVKTYLPNYGEFYERRWFASSEELPLEGRSSSYISLSDSSYMLNVYGGHLVFSLDDVKFGVEICEDVWSPIPPSSQLALQGADIILNLSATDELIGKHHYLKSLLSQQSARSLSGYVYSSCGFGESTQDVVYGGNAMIYENGRLLAEGERFSLEAQLVTAQIDVERLRAERRANMTFAASRRQTTSSRNEELVLEGFRNSHDIFSMNRIVDPHPFIPKTEDMQASCEEIFNIQVMGLAKRLVHTHCQRVIVGISGGLDSTLALLVCVKTFDKLGFDRKGIVGVTMPGFGTTDRTHTNAVSLMQSLGVTLREVNISAAVMQHFADIGHDAQVHDVTYENSQARERTQILMDLSNQLGGLVIGTGDLSELALGWATYNGDHMSMYGVNASIPKTLIRHLVNYVAQSGVDEESRKTLLDIIDTPISPELIPADEEGNIKQKTEDLVGPYELHDFFLYYMLRFGFSPSKIFFLALRAFDGSHAEAPAYDRQTIKKWLSTFCRRFFAQQFKRSCLPDGPKVGSVSLSPRGDWRMPSDAMSALWLKECETL
ncbi:MAG: NAD(+) synthase [Prevotella sp.]|nr:NAD(+) synthase [Prevotella sp.]MDD7047248.1 NAD(+) synthase [Prevotella sp.]MDY5545830.1 NAD(+) synthase [Prevotella sp.]